MKSPMRVVCEGCLRSVEIEAAGLVAVQAACPSCGRPIDSREIDGEPSADETHVPRPSSESRIADTPETIDWAQTWSRGTLGSLGRFQLRERLGDGGFGQVYLAYDPRLDRDVALKVLKQPEPSDRVMERFFREARAVARLDHPNIVSVLDAGRDENRCWVAYQLVSGRPLWWYRERQRMDPTTSARIIRDLADALGHAHAMGVVHRDIKPGNVMIDDRGRPRLIDFGLARRSDLESDLTRDGVVVGTPTYMSPEQAIGMSRQADERSDVYSLGVLFYELLCGRRPQEVSRSTSDPPPGPPGMPSPLPDVRSIRRGTPARLAAICARAMAPRPSDRYPSARALMEAIDGWLASRRDRGIRMATGALGLIVLLGMALSAVSVPRLIFKGEAPPAAPLAQVAATAPSAPSVSPARAVARSDRAGAGAGESRFAEGQLVYSKKGDSKYHVFPCAYTKEATPATWGVLGSHTDADERGLTLCSRCRARLREAGKLPTDASRNGD